MSAHYAVQVGDRLGPWTLRITREQVRRYAEASGDHNPIHLDDAAARALGLPGLVAHGMLTSAVAIGRIAAWAGGSDRIRSTFIRFASPVLVPAGRPAEIEVIATVRGVDPETGTAEVALDARCDGVRIFGKAVVAVILAADFRPTQSVT